MNFFKNADTSWTNYWKYEINTYVVQKIINKLIDGDYSLNVIKKNKHLIAQFFDYTIDNKWITENSILVAEWFLIYFRRHNLDKYNIYFYELRHTFSNMLFEMNENPKVIQQLLGHRDVKTTITVYNSVDNEYIRQTTEKFNEKVKEDQLILEQKKREEVLEDRKEKFVKDMSDDEFDDMLQQLMEKRKEWKRKREKDFKM